MGLFDSLKKKAKQFGLDEAVDALDAIDSVKKTLGDLKGGNLKKKIGELGLLDDVADIAEEFGLGGIASKVKSASSKSEPASAPEPMAKPAEKPASKLAPKPAPVPISMEEIGKYVEGLNGVKKVYISDKLVIGYLPVYSTDAGDVLVEPAIRIILNDEGVKVMADFSLPSKIAGNFYECDESQCRTIEAGLSAAAGDLYDKHEYNIGLGVSVRVWRQFRADELNTDSVIKKTILLGIYALIKETPDAGNLRIRSINSEISVNKSRMERERAEVERFFRMEQERMEREEQERRAREEQERRAREQERRRAVAQERSEAENARRKGLNQSFTYTLRDSGTVRRLQEAFTEDYPYLRIGVYMVKTGQSADKDGGTISSYESDTTFGDIRSFKGECKVEINGSDSPKDLEAHFRKVSGLVIKICYNDEDDERYYISKNNKWYTMSIYDIDRAFREKGYKKADIS